MKAFRKILIADQGETALRIIRTCREMGIRSVAVYSDADKRSPHARLADEAVFVGSDRTIERILEAARKTGADAVHPGCGLLAESPDFAAACESAGLTFVGPSSETIRIANSKERTTWLPVSGSQPRPTETGEDVSREARRIAFPILGDVQGNLLDLVEHDNTVRQGQLSIVEESPCPALNDDLRRRMGQAAVGVARAVNYCNVGAVEFLLTPSGEFHSFSIIPRLPAGYLVSEMVVEALDLVRLQIEIAEGRPLPPPLYPPLAKGGHRKDGHAIAARLCEEGEYKEGGAPAQPFGDAKTITAHGPDRETALRKLIFALRNLWVQARTNKDLLLHVLESQTFRDGRAHVGFLDDRPFTATSNRAQDFIFAAVLVLYLEVSRHARRALLPGVPPNYRNNPYRDPTMKVRIGTMDFAISWRHLGHGRYDVYSGERRIEAEVLSLTPVSGEPEIAEMPVAVDGVQRTFQFREVGDEFFVHSVLGSRVIQRLPRYPAAQGPAVGRPPVIRTPGRGLAAAERKDGREGWKASK